jgi:hypothetical protein
MLPLWRAYECPPAEWRRLLRRTQSRPALERPWRRSYATAVCRERRYMSPYPPPPPVPPSSHRPDNGPRMPMFVGGVSYGHPDGIDPAELQAEQRRQRKEKEGWQQGRWTLEVGPWAWLKRGVRV